MLIGVFFEVKEKVVVDVVFLGWNNDLVFLVVDGYSVFVYVDVICVYLVFVIN